MKSFNNSRFEPNATGVVKKHKQFYQFRIQLGNVLQKMAYSL